MASAHFSPSERVRYRSCLFVSVRKYGKLLSYASYNSDTTFGRNRTDATCFCLLSRFDCRPDHRESEVGDQGGRIRHRGAPTDRRRGRFRKRKKSYAKRALMPPRRGIGRTHGKRCLKVCNAASLSVFSDEQHGFFGVDFVMRNVQLEVLRIHQRL